MHLGSNGPARWLTLAVVTVIGSGCWWHRDTYTERMERTAKNWKLDAELARLLGGKFDHGETSVSIRAPKPTVLVQQADPPPFTALFQGGDPMIEMIVIASVGSESLGEFEKASMATLAANQRGPGGEYEQQSAVEVESIYGGRTAFSLYQASAQRQTASGTPLAFHWLLYFAEEGQQKVMVAYIIPDSKYASFTENLQKSLESLALGSKFSVAQTGAPSGG